MANSQVAFYIIARPTQSAEQVACILAMKAWAQGHRVAVCAPTEQAVHRLDEMMWDQPTGRFLPHETDDGSTAPVLIRHGNTGIPGDRDLVINLCIEPVPEPERFSRLCEVVPAQPEQRTASRNKYRAYRDKQLSPETHEIGKN
jgi:DNA polymerase-3 subunit chi